MVAFASRLSLHLIAPVHDVNCPERYLTGKRPAWVPMNKSWFDNDHLITVGKICLLASILMGIILVGRASYSPTATSAIATHESLTATNDHTTRPPAPSDPLIAPRHAADCTFQLDIDLKPERERKHTNSFCLRTSTGQRYLVSHASILMKGAWDEVTTISIPVLAGKQAVAVERKPLYLGPFAEDNQPNMLLNPDLGFDLVIWPMPSAISASGLLLASKDSLPGENVWLIGALDSKTNARPLYLCRVLKMSENELTVQTIDRVAIEVTIGLPVVNQKGELIGTVLGGNDQVLTGASASALKRRLMSIDLQHGSPDR